MGWNQPALKTRRQTLALLGGGIAGGLVALAGDSGGLAAGTSELVTVYKSPSCGCCGLWARHLQKNGFRVRTINENDLEPIKRAAQVPEVLASCHTAFVEGYVIEGHVPAVAVRKLLAERPKVIGIAVPGMPLGSPGMPSDEREPFDVVAFSGEGALQRYMSF